MKKWFTAIQVISFTIFVGFVETQLTKSKPNTKIIAIATLMSHPALDAVQENLIKELERQGICDGKNVRYVIKNANGQVQMAVNIATDLASQKPDVIVAITIPMACAIVKTARCPVIFAAVSDPVGAGLVKSVDFGEPTITGTSDAWPFEDQLKIIRKITPNVRRIGILYNPETAYSQY
jgi:putative tryptophan/tyrosine transport system substrate-binding protein